MPCTSFNPQATNAKLARSIRMIVLHPISLLMIAAGLGGLCVLAAFANRPDAGFIAVSVALFALHVIASYLHERLESAKATIHDQSNAAEWLSAELVEYLLKSKNVTGEALLRAVVASKRVAFILSVMGIAKERVLEAGAKDPQGIDPLTIANAALPMLPAGTSARIEANMILFLLMRQSKPFNDLLNEADLSLEEASHVFAWEEHRHIQGQKPAWYTPDGLRASIGSVGRSWATGYTNDLDRLTQEMSEGILSRLRGRNMIHAQQIDTIRRILSRNTQGNALLLGRPGVGKRSLVDNVAYTLQRDEQRRALTYTRVLALRTEQLLSGIANADTFLLHALGKAQEAGRFILVIRDLPQILRAGDAKLTGVLLRFLQAKNINVIAIADPSEYHELIKNNPGLDSLFEKINVEDATEDETLDVLMERVNAHGTSSLTFKALRSIVDLSKRYIGKGGMPGKAIEVLEDAIVLAKSRHEGQITEAHIREVVSQKANMNLNKVNEGEKEKLLNLEERLKKRMIGQGDAIDALVSTLKRARLEIHGGKKPLGTFLFLGPTGVGKTQMAKALAEEYFGAADRMVRLDMNEYSTPESVINITGGNDGKGGFRDGFLARRVQDTPFSLVLLDEIEKAHPSVLNLFLQILDEGAMIDGRGTRTDFRNTIFIATSNAGALFFSRLVREHPEYKKDQLKNLLLEEIVERQKLYSPEFVNRFDNVIMFFPLTEEQAARLASLMVESVVRDFRDSKGITVRIEAELLREIGKRGYSPEFGAREMRRVVLETIENFLADYLLANEPKRGSEILIRLQDVKWKND